jgi:hypothetical protein
MPSKDHVEICREMPASLSKEKPICGIANIVVERLWIEMICQIE